MNGILEFGPWMIALERLLAIALIWAFVGIGAFVALRTASRAGRASWFAGAAGIVVARLGYVLENIAAFTVEPWTVLAMWQGGFSLWPGIAAAALVLIIAMRRSRATAAMLTALGALALAHAGITAWLAPPIRPLPAGIVVTDLAGRPFALDSLRGQPFALNLWATWCPPCRRELPMLIDVARQSTTPIYLVNQREAPAAVSAFLKREGLSDAAVRLDPAGALVQMTNSPALPTTLFIDAEGQIRGTHTGEISRAAMTAALRDLERNH